MIGKNKIALALDGNPDMQAMFAGKQPGDEMELKCVKCQVAEVTADQAVLTVTEVESEEEEKSEGEGEGDEYPKAEAPALVMVRGKGKTETFGE